MGKVKIGNFKGPQGETGPQGPAGPQGPEGPQGPMGEVDANTQIVFTQAASRENIASGERLNIILGKIRKWFADIKGAAFQDVSNTLTTTEAGKVLDARQGKVLDEKVTEKVDKTDVVNGLTETAAGKVLDARQGKVLDEKIDNLRKEVSDLNSKLKLTHTFSTSAEIDTGETWVDGKRIYRRTYITTDTVSPSNALTIPMSLKNIADTLWIDTQNSYIRSADGGQSYPLPLPRYSGTENYVGVWCNGAGIRIFSDSGWNESWEKCVTVRYTKV